MSCLMKPSSSSSTVVLFFFYVFHNSIYMSNNLRTNMDLSEWTF